MLGDIFNQILYRPIFNLLVFLYNIIPGHDFGIAIILLTILVRIILFPFAYHSVKSRQAMAVIQPKIKEIQQKYKNNKEEQSRELMKIYKEHGVNPFSGCLTLLVQLPVLIALYQVLIKALKPENLSALYPFVENPNLIEPSFLGILDLSAPSAVLAVLAGIIQFFYSKLTMKYSPQPIQPSGEQKGQGMQKAMSQSMVYYMPFLTIIIGLKLPAGLSLYWFISTLLAFVQDYYLLKKKKQPISGKPA